MNTDNNTTKNDLSYLFAVLQSSDLIEDPDNLSPELKQKIEKDQLIWKAFLDQQGELLREGLSVFKAYDLQGKLVRFFESIDKKRPLGDEKTFLTLVEYALKAYDDGVLKDAYAMLSLIIALYPLHVKPYLYLGDVTQKLHGNEAGARFYKSVTVLFKEPDLLFLAASCEMDLNHVQESKDYLTQAQTALQEKGNLDDVDRELLERINNLIADLQQVE